MTYNSDGIEKALRKINFHEEIEAVIVDDFLGFYHENDLETIELVSLEKKGCDMYGKSLEEIRKAGPEFLAEIMHPDDIEPCISKLIAFKLEDNEGKTLTYVQRLKMTFSNEYKPYFTCVRINRERGVFQSVTTPMTQIDSVKEEVMKALDDAAQFEEYMSVYTELSKREREIIGKVCLGYDVKTIADQLFLSPHTVEKHKKNIVKKSGFQSNAELMRFGLFFNLIAE